jgi:hypothetical protein
MKLKCYELSQMLGGDSHGHILDGKGYIFKSGKDVKIRFVDVGNPKLEQNTLDFLRSKGLKCLPDTIPTDGYYTVEW